MSVFDAMRESMEEPRFRGCAFSRASAESRLNGGVQSVCDEARGWLRTLFVDLAGRAGAKNPEALAQKLVLLYDGASVGAQMDGGTASAVVARQTAQALLDLDIGEAKPKRRAKSPKAESH